MAAPVSAEFLAAQSRRTREPKKEVFLIGNNPATPTQGASVTASSEFSADYPATGTIDGDRTHINYGPAAGADNEKGRSGWRSADSSVEDTWDTPAEIYGSKLIDDTIQATAYAGNLARAHFPHNVHSYSEQLDHASWSPTLITITADDALAPDGTLTAERIVETTGTGQHGIRKNFNRTPNARIPVAIFAKAGTGGTARNWIYIEANDTGVTNITRQWFDVGAGVIGSTVNQGVGWTTIPGSQRIRPVRNKPGWFRCEMIVQAPAAGGTSQTGFYITQGDASVGYTGLLGYYLHMWGAAAQDEGEFVGPYSKNVAGTTWGYSTTFDPMVPATPLGGQEIWVVRSVVGAGAIDVEAVAARAGSVNGVHAHAPGPTAASAITTLPIRPGPGLNVFKFWARMNSAGFSTDLLTIQLIDTVGAAQVVAMIVDSSILFEGNPVVRTFIGPVDQGPVFNDHQVILNEWAEYTFVLDRTVPADTLLKLFIKRETEQRATEVWRGISDSTGLDVIDLTVINLNPATPPIPDWYIDDLNWTEGFAAESVLAEVLDLGAIPSGFDGELEIIADQEVVERLVDGAWYKLTNREGGTFALLRDIAGNEAIGQTFTPTTKDPITAVTFDMGQVGAPSGTYWVEILKTLAGVPTGGVMSRSVSRTCRTTLPSGATKQRFTFPTPFVPDGTSMYAYRIRGDFPIDPAHYVFSTHHTTAPSYGGGQAFRWDGTTYTMVPGEDLPFVTWTNQLVLEDFDTGTEDTDLKLHDSSSQYWLAQGFEVDREKDALYFAVSMKMLSLFSDGAIDWEFWLDLHADDGSGTKPSNEVLAVGLRRDPTVVTWTTYKWFPFRLLAPYKLRPGVKYWWVLKGSIEVLAGEAISQFHAFGADDSSPTYARGNRAISTEADPKVWTAVPGGAMPFRIYEEERPYWATQIAYSADDVTYTTPIDVEPNGARLGSFESEFTGEASRYWMARASAIVPGTERAFAPIFRAMRLRARYVTPNYVTIDLGQIRTIDLVRLFGHPVSGGISDFRISKSDDDILYTDILGTDFRPETLESYGYGEDDNQGVTISGGDPTRLTIGAPYFNGQLAASHSMRYLRVTVLDSPWEFAELLEIQVFRVIDLSERIVEMRDSRSGDFLLLRVRQKELDLVLDNHDRVFSSRNTAGPYYGNLGGGTQIVAYVGYEGVQDMVKTGVFYVDEWNETARGAELPVHATDGMKVLDTDTRPNYKQGFGYNEIIQYLANLANWPSQWIATDRAAGIVDFFAPEKANAWQEIQKIGEAASASRVWIDRNGRLRMRLTGTSAADLRLGTFLRSDDFRRSEGPPVFIGEKLYVSVIVETDYGSGLQQEIKVVEYDLTTKTWQYVAGGRPIFTQPTPGDAFGFSTQVVYRGELFVIFHYNPLDQEGVQVAKWDGSYVDTPAAWEVMYERADAAFTIPSPTAGLGSTRIVTPSALIRNLFLTFSPEPTDSSHYRFDMETMEYWKTTGASTIEGAVVVDLGGFGDYLYFSNQSGSGYPPQQGRWNFAQMRVEKLSDIVASEYKLMSFLNVTPFLHEGGRVFGMGMDVDDDRNLYTSLVGKEGPTIPGRIWRQSINTGVRDFSPNAYDPSFAPISDNARTGVCVVWQDDIVLAGSERTAVTRELHLLQWETKQNEIVDVGSISLSNTRLITFVKHVFNGQNVIYGIADEGRVIEMYVRRKLPLQTTPVFAIEDGSDGEFENATLAAGDDAGASRIINTAIVTSTPLAILPSEKVWEGSRLPWPIAPGTILDFGASLREMALPYDAADPNSQRITITASGFAWTATLKPHHKRPTLLIVITAGPVGGGLLTGIEINGDTLKENSTLISYIFGSADSFEKFGLRRHELQNNYVYDSFAQNLVGASLVSRFQYERARISGLSIRARWELEEFDLVSLLERNNLFLDGNFYIVKINRNYHGAQNMSLEVEEGLV